MNDTTRSDAHPATILIVDDEPLNIELLEQELDDLGYTTISACNGQEALAIVAKTPPDMLLLDIMMPVMDGFGVLEKLKANPETCDIPVVVISALTDMPHIVRSILGGAIDFLPKPFDPVLLTARVRVCLEQKRLRDTEQAYLRHVAHLTDAAIAVEESRFDVHTLDPISARTDALGHLARVFQRMAREVLLREQRLRHQIIQLEQDMVDWRQARHERAAAYLPMDRRVALAQGRPLPRLSMGAALFADISGFTPLTEALAHEMGHQRGAEELTRQINRVYDVMIDVLHRYRGSAICFSGDAITCWFPDDNGMRATACGTAMQSAMIHIPPAVMPSGVTYVCGLKVVVNAGQARRWLVGDPEIQRIELLVGRTIDRLAVGDHLAARGDVLVAAPICIAHPDALTITEWRTDLQGERWAVVAGLTVPVAETPWPPEPDLADEDVRPWLLADVYMKVCDGTSAVLAELRVATALFLHFGEIDEGAPEAEAEIDQLLRWTQDIVRSHSGVLLQVTIGDKGNYLYAAFGIPRAHEDDASHAVAAGMALLTPPPGIVVNRTLRVGIAHGVMRAGAYGATSQRTYGILGDATNLAARLMMVADPILCDAQLARAAAEHWNFAELPPIEVKGKTTPQQVFRPIGLARQRILILDERSSAEQLLLKTASVIGLEVRLDILHAIIPADYTHAQMEELLDSLCRCRLLTRSPERQTVVWGDAAVREATYERMLFAQRRQLHRAIAEWYEQHDAQDVSSYYALLAGHWSRAEEATRALHYLERAAEAAQQSGEHAEALALLQVALALESPNRTRREEGE
jgi:CheY-like chemotaxis protein/class 3 adenylate cyclase